MKKTYAIINYGCQMNESDSEHYAGQLLDLGYEASADYEHADVVVINTCCVRENAEKKILGKIGEMKRLKRENPDMVLCVAGCMAQEWGKDLQKKYPQVDLVLGTAHVNNFSSILQNHLAGHGRAESVYDDLAIMPQEFEGSFVRKSSFAAWVPIMYGCNNFCTYCIVPYVRGRERSREPAAILAEFRQLVEQGYKEITLLGQNVNSYGKGLEHPIDFADLLNLLCEVPGDYQIRFMTSHPKDASRKLIDTIAAQEHLCKHIHLPVQSGSDRLLKEMNRHYNVAQYMDLIRYAKEKIPGVTFSSDIIVGFPGETEEDFAATLDLIREVGYMQLFTFIYSKRAGTPAAKLPDPTTHAEKAARMDRLLKTQEEFAFAATAAMAGRTVRVLVEAAGRNEGTVNGRLDNNLVVEFKAPESLIGQWADVHITGSRAALLVGELAE